MIGLPVCHYRSEKAEICKASIFQGALPAWLRKMKLEPLPGAKILKVWMNLGLCQILCVNMLCRNCSLHKPSISNIVQVEEVAIPHTLAYMFHLPECSAARLPA